MVTVVTVRGRSPAKGRSRTVNDTQSSTPSHTNIVTDDICPVCREPLNSNCINFRCNDFNHKFCRDCYKNLRTNAITNEIDCPLCRTRHYAYPSGPVPVPVRVPEAEPVPVPVRVPEAEPAPVPVRVPEAEPERASGPDIAPVFTLGLIIFFAVTCGFVVTMQFVGFILLLISYICIIMMIIMECARKAGIEDGDAAMLGIVGFVVISVVLTDLSSFGLVSKEFPEWCAIVVGIIVTYWLLNQCYKEYK